MTKYSEIAELPDGNRLFIHYNEEQSPVWLEYWNVKTDKSIKYGRIDGLDLDGLRFKTSKRKTRKVKPLPKMKTRKVW